MINKISSTLIYSLLAILIVGNIMLLLNNSKLKSHLVSIKNASSIENPFTNYEMVSTIKMIHPEIIKKFKDISVKILIPDGSCISCLEFEIPNISKLYESFPDLVTVYTFGDSEVLKGSEFSFKSESIDSKKKLFDRELEYSNPIVALTNHKGEVIQFYIAETGRSVKSDNFYERLGLLLGGI